MLARVLDLGDAEDLAMGQAGVRSTHADIVARIGGRFSGQFGGGLRMTD